MLPRSNLHPACPGRLTSLALLLVLCAGAILPHGATPLSIARAQADATPVPLSDLGQGTYKGFQGGLYPGGLNVPPAAHWQSGIARGRQVIPRDTAGLPDTDGTAVLLSIGMSNTTQEFCADGPIEPCTAWSFVGRSLADPQVAHGRVTLVNGAMGNQAADSWDSPDESNYDRINEALLQPRGLSEQQVQVIWLKVANRGSLSRPALPAADADAFVLLSALGNTVRALKMRPGSQPNPTAASPPRPRHAR